MPPERIEPHEWVYGGFEVMGDCGKCGRVPDDPIHKLMPPDPVDTQALIAEATRHADAAMVDLEMETGDARSEYYTQGLTNWIPALVHHVEALAVELAVCRDRADREKNRADFAEAALKDDAALNAAVRQRDEQQARADRLWEIVGLAEAAFTAASEEESDLAFVEFGRHVEALRNPVTTEGET